MAATASRRGGVCLAVLDARPQPGRPEVLTTPKALASHPRTILFLQKHTPFGALFNEARALTHTRAAYRVL